MNMMISFDTVLLFASTLLTCFSEQMNGE